MALLDKVDDIQESLRHVERQCHRTLKHHASIVDVLSRDSKVSNYTVMLSEEVDLHEDDEEERMEFLGGIKEEEVEEEERETVEEDDEHEIKVGDMVVCIGGKKLGGRQRCTVVEVSDSKKTYILEDSEGVRFRKHRHTIEK